LARTATVALISGVARSPPGSRVDGPAEAFTLMAAHLRHVAVMYYALRAASVGLVGKRGRDSGRTGWALRGTATGSYRPGADVHIVISKF